MSYVQWLTRGLIAGGIAGVLAGIVGVLVVQPVIRLALAIEETRSAVPGDAHHEELFGRSTQVLGGFLATVLVGLAIGAMFATALALTSRLHPSSRAFPRALTSAAIGFGAVVLLPAMKYPANPPGVGDTATVNQRTVLYFSLMAAGLLIAFGAGRLGAYLAARTSLPVSWRATAVAAATAAGVVVVLVIWPASPDSVPADIPAALLWDFRVASLAGLAALWGVLGFAFGLLTERSTREVTAATG